MKLRRKLLVLTLVDLLVGGVWANPIQDPITDYLSLQVPDRSEFIGTLEFVRRVKVDVDGDGKDETFIGTWYRHSGSNRAYYWSAYKQVQGGYERITAANKDIHIASFENAYIDLIAESSKQGIVAAYDIEVDTSENADVTKVGELHFYCIANDSLADQNFGALDLSNPAHKTIYERYFGPDVQTRKPSSIETFSNQQLQEMGYQIPNWEPSAP